MSRDAEKGAMITAGIEAAHVEVPVIVGDNQHIRLDELTFAPGILSHQTLVPG
jgi:hypothetical protein